MSATPTILKRANYNTNHKVGNFNNAVKYENKSLVKLDNSTRLIINKIPATIKPTMKRQQNTVTESAPKSTKYSLQTINSSGTPLTSLQWQTISNNSTGRSTSSTATITKKQQHQQLGAVISSLPPNTIIQAKSTGQVLNVQNSVLTTNETSHALSETITTVTSNASQGGGTMQVRRPTVYIKHDSPKRSTRDITTELIEKSPQLHLGIQANRLNLVKAIVCETANVSLVDCYMTLKKIRQNEDFAVLADYFETTEAEAQQIFARTITKLARYMRFLVRWPDTNKRYDRLKNLPFGYRCKMSHVQSMIECVETDLQEPAQMDCLSYKYILGITPNGVICYVSEAFIGYHDDLVIFNASNFHNTKPPYLDLVADPGKAIRRKRLPHNRQSAATENDSTTDSADESVEEDPETESCRPIGRYGSARIAGEIASYNTLSIVNKELTSSKVKETSVPITRMPGTTMCRDLLHEVVDNLRDFKILQHHGIKEPLVYQYINEVLICAAALINLQR